MSGDKAQQEGRRLSLADILAKQDIKVKKIFVPEWGEGEYVFIRSMTAFSRDIYDQVITSFEEVDGKPRLLFDRRNIRAWTVALCLCDEAGKAELQVPRLATKEEEDKVKGTIEQLGDRLGSAMDRLYLECMRLNRLRDEDLVDLVKDSRPDPVEGSPSS